MFYNDLKSKNSTILIFLRILFIILITFLVAEFRMEFCYKLILNEIIIIQGINNMTKNLASLAKEVASSI